MTSNSAPIVTTCPTCSNSAPNPLRAVHRDEGRCLIDHRIRELRSQGAGPKEIGSLVGLTPSAVRYRLQTLRAMDRRRERRAEREQVRVVRQTPRRGRADPEVPSDTERAERRAAEYVEQLISEGYPPATAKKRARAAYGLARVAAAHYEPAFTRAISIAHVVATAMSRGGES